MIDAAVNGTPVKALLDSAAEASFLDRSFARQLALTPGQEVAASGSGKQDFTASLAQDVTLQAVGLTLPHQTVAVADLGDVAINTFDLKKTVDIITAHYRGVLAEGVIPLTLGGDHTLTWPILRAIKERHGPVALIHVDAHADINDTMFGETVAHGCPFRRAWEDGCLLNDKVFQIGLRATGYAADDFNWGRDKGWTVVQAEECWHKSLTPLMQIVRDRIGDAPVYLTYDIDSLDSAFAPGTGTVEPGGLSTWQGLEIIRGCAGLDLVGCDLVEVSPPYDPSGNTALIAANFLYEMLCVLPGVPQNRSRFSGLAF